MRQTSAATGWAGAVPAIVTSAGEGGPAPRRRAACGRTAAGWRA